MQLGAERLRPLRCRLVHPARPSTATAAAACQTPLCQRAIVSASCSPWTWPRSGLVVLASSKRSARSVSRLHALREGEQGDRRDVWASKPPWCQPWTIVLTGGSVVAGSWQFFHAWWLTAPAVAAVGAWWWLFLVLYPSSYSSSFIDVERSGREEES